MRQSDEEAFVAFVHARSASLLGTAWALTRDRQLAEDLVQSALAKCYVAWPRIRSDDPEAYVRRTMANAQRNVWRRRLPSIQWSAEVPEPAEGRTSFEHSVVDRRTLLDAVATLSPRQRTVIVLRYYEDRTDTEIAQLMGCSVGAVKRHATRALRHLEENVGVGELAPRPSLQSRTVS